MQARNSHVNWCTCGMYIDTSARPFAWKITLGGTGMECTAHESMTHQLTSGQKRARVLHASYDRAYQKGLAWSKDIVCIQYSHILFDI